MTKTETAADAAKGLHTCKWTRPGIRLEGVEEWLQPETPWVCVRTGERIPASESRCKECPYWEADSTADR